jgi:hypothetical protein
MILITEIERRINEEDTTITLTVEAIVTIVPANFRGHPDNWTPDESECDIQSITDEEGNDWTNELTSKEYDDLVQRCFQEAESDTQGNELD